MLFMDRADLKEDSFLMVNTETMKPRSKQVPVNQIIKCDKFPRGKVQYGNDPVPDYNHGFRWVTVAGALVITAGWMICCRR